MTAPRKRKPRKRRPRNGSSRYYDMTTDASGRKKKTLWQNDLWGF